MGLDINVYKKLKEVKNPQIDEYGDLVNWKSEWTPGASMDWSETHFPGRGQGIESHKIYTFEDKDSFRAGSYFGYNHWRNVLNEFKGDIAFQELINFADNEGVIGPIVSKKLYEYFKKYEEEAIKFTTESEQADESWLNKYYLWMNAFRDASDNGAVEFC